MDLDEATPRWCLRNLMRYRVCDYSNVGEFVRVLDFRHHQMASQPGGAWSHRTRIWHCLSCLDEAKSKDLSLVLKEFSTPDYWDTYKTWDSFVKHLVVVAGHIQVLPPTAKPAVAAPESKPAAVAPKSKPVAAAPESKPAAAAPKSKPDARSHGTSTKESVPYYSDDDDDDVDTASDDDNDFEQEHLRRRKNNDKAEGRRSRGKPFGPAVHEFTDYQFRSDDNAAFVDKDQDAVMINGERRYRIPGYNKARRNRRGMLIDAKLSAQKYYFFKRFTFKPKCHDCKLRHPIEAYSFCRHCYICHLGGEEECYHMHPELRGTRAAKDKYVGYAAKPEEGKLYHKKDLAEFGYDASNTFSRSRVRKMRQFVRQLPADEQDEWVQLLLDLMTADRVRLRAAQAAKQQQQVDIEKQQRDREEQERKAHEALTQRIVETGGDPDALAQELLNLVVSKIQQTADKMKPATKATNKPTVAVNGQPLAKQPTPTSSRAATPAVSSQGSTSRFVATPSQSSQSSQPISLPLRPAPGVASANIATLPGNGASTLGANLNLLSPEPQQKGAQGTDGPAPKASRSLKNKKSWQSMASLSTSSDGESIQHFNKQRQKAKGKAVSSQSRQPERNKGKATSSQSSQPAQTSSSQQARTKDKAMSSQSRPPDATTWSYSVVPAQTTPSQPSQPTRTTSSQPTRTPSSQSVRTASSQPARTASSQSRRPARTTSSQQARAKDKAVSSQSRQPSQPVRTTSSQPSQPTRSGGPGGYGSNYWGEGGDRYDGGSWYGGEYGGEGGDRGGGYDRYGGSTAGGGYGGPSQPGRSWY